MKQDSSGAFLMQQGDVFDNSIDPNLSGSGFEVVQDGDGDDSTFVKLFGFGYGDPFVVKAKMGAQMRGVPGPEHSNEEKAYIRSFVSVVNARGEKVILGQWPEA
jgi:hypothetical protein